MDEKMKKALLDCCERNCKVISPDVVAFAKDLVNTAISTSENKIDDMFTPIINKGFEVLDEFLLKQVDKIDGATAKCLTFQRLLKQFQTQLKAALTLPPQPKNTSPKRKSSKKSGT